MPETIKDRLHAVLATINRPGVFCATGSKLAANPGLDVRGLGRITLPLTVHQANELKLCCEQAPYGKGELTVVDTSVRRVWKMEPEQFKILNPDWTEFLKDAMTTVQMELGLAEQKLECHLYNLLLYEPGGFFLPHRDGEKLERMVATMVVLLPSTFEGGELVVKHDGQIRTIDFSSKEFNPFHTHFAAFYADCEHEVRPLHYGHRLALVYNLTLAKAKKAIRAPRTTQQVEAVAKVLRSWKSDEPMHKLAVILGHQYTKSGLSWNQLKGVDRTKATVLYAAAKLAECTAYLTKLELFESGSCEGTYRETRGRGWSVKPPPGEYKMEEVYEHSLTVADWVDAEGMQPGYDVMDVAIEEIIPREALTSIVPEEDYEGYTGNAGLTLDRWYRHAAIVLLSLIHI